MSDKVKFQYYIRAFQELEEYISFNTKEDIKLFGFRFKLKNPVHHLDSNDVLVSITHVNVMWLPGSTGIEMALIDRYDIVYIPSLGYSNVCSFSSIDDSIEELSRIVQSGVVLTDTTVATTITTTAEVSSIAESDEVIDTITKS